MISVTVYMISNLLYGVKHHFQQYSVISWRSVLLVEETGVQGETTNLSVRKIFHTKLTIGKCIYLSEICVNYMEYSKIFI